MPVPDRRSEEQRRVFQAVGGLRKALRKARSLYQRRREAPLAAVLPSRLPRARFEKRESGPGTVNCADDRTLTVFPKLGCVSACPQSRIENRESDVYRAEVLMLM